MGFIFRCILALISITASARADLLAGFAEADITPTLSPDKPVYLAGYGHGRAATKVHDPLMARAVVLSDGKAKIAFVCGDVVGIMRREVLAVRAKLPGFDYVMVSATHNHEGPDTIGLWGRSPFVSGVDAKYMAMLVERCAAAVKDAEQNLAPVTAAYGTAEDETLLGDSRLPKVRDGVLRVLRFTRKADGKTHGLLVQWNCHPEAMGSKNTQLTADFPWATVAALKARHGCPVAYFSGAVGGLMAPPDGVVKDANGNELKEGDFAYAETYGRMVAALADKAVAAAEPIELTPMKVNSAAFCVPLANSIYMALRKASVLDREAFISTGDPLRRGEPFDQLLHADKTPAIETETAYLKLGSLHVACIPGEIYPELIYGKIQDPAEPNADFPDAPKEKHVMSLLPGVPGVPGVPGEKVLIIGLANDEIGYILPKRQWDLAPPYAYGRSRGQYGEVNSVGPETGPVLMKVLAGVVKEAK